MGILKKNGTWYRGGKPLSIFNDPGTNDFRVIDGIYQTPPAEYGSYTAEDKIDFALEPGKTFSFKAKLDDSFNDKVLFSSAQLCLRRHTDKIALWTRYVNHIHFLVGGPADANVVNVEVNGETIDNSNSNLWNLLRFDNRGRFVTWGGFTNSYTDIGDFIDATDDDEFILLATKGGSTDPTIGSTIDTKLGCRLYEFRDDANHNYVLLGRKYNFELEELFRSAKSPSGGIEITQNFIMGEGFFEGDNGIPLINDSLEHDITFRINADGSYSLFLDGDHQYTSGAGWLPSDYWVTHNGEIDLEGMDNWYHFTMKDGRYNSVDNPYYAPISGTPRMLDEGPNALEVPMSGGLTYPDQSFLPHSEGHIIDIGGAISSGKYAETTSFKFGSTEEITVMFFYSPWSNQNSSYVPNEDRFAVHVTESPYGTTNDYLTIKMRSSGEIYFKAGQPAGYGDVLTSEVTLEDLQVETGAGGRYMCHLWAFTKNTNTGLMRIYRDGVLFGQSSGNTTQIGVLDAPRKLTFFNDGSSRTHDFHGAMINPMILPVELSAQQIRQACLYIPVGHTGPKPYNFTRYLKSGNSRITLSNKTRLSEPVYWWETKGTVGVDAHIDKMSGHNLSLVDITMGVGPKGIPNSAFYFNGTSSSAITINRTRTDISPWGDFSISCWMKIDSGGGGQGWNITEIHNPWAPGGESNQFLYFEFADDGEGRTNLYQQAPTWRGAAGRSVFYNRARDDDGWVHIVYVWHACQDKPPYPPDYATTNRSCVIDVYFNGIPNMGEKEGNHGNGLPSVWPFPADEIPPNYTRTWYEWMFGIGSHLNVESGGGNPYYFGSPNCDMEGYIADVRVYDFAMTVDEIREMYYETFAPANQYKDVVVYDEALSDEDIKKIHTFGG